MKKEFCEYCMKDTEVEYKERMKEEIYYGNDKVEYLEKYYVCKECGGELYGDLLDYNITTVHNKLRELHNLPPIDNSTKIEIQLVEE